MVEALKKRGVAAEYMVKDNEATVSVCRRTVWFYEAMEASTWKTARSRRAARTTVLPILAGRLAGFVAAAGVRQRTRWLRLFYPRRMASTVRPVASSGDLRRDDRSIAGPPARHATWQGRVSAQPSIMFTQAVLRRMSWLRAKNKASSAISGAIGGGTQATGRSSRRSPQRLVHAMLYRRSQAIACDTSAGDVGDRMRCQTRRS